MKVSFFFSRQNLRFLEFFYPVYSFKHTGVSALCAAVSGTGSTAQHSTAVLRVELQLQLMFFCAWGTDTSLDTNVKQHGAHWCRNETFPRFA